MSCISSVFNITQDSISKEGGIQMRYKRVANYSTMDAIDAFISEVINKVLSNQNNVSFYSTNAIESIKKNNSLDKIAKDTYMDYLQLI